MQQTTNINVYPSDYRFLVADTILTLAFILMIVPTFSGWWELGRRVTLNLIEIAKAFDAPLLLGPGSNAPLDKLIETMGTRGLKLGEVENRAASPVLEKQVKITNPEEVLRPRARAVYV